MSFYRIKIILKALFIQSEFLILAILLLPASFFYKVFIFKKTLWLIGENDGKCLNDNGYIFYKFCRINHQHKSIYFVTKKESINFDPFLRKDPNSIIYGSLKHIFFFLLATTIIYTHSHSDVAYIQILKLFKINCKRVFLQHGIIAFKQIDSIYRKNHNEMDIFVVSSDFEKRIVLENFNFNKNIVKVTGLARHDRLLKTSSPSQKSILYLPTWRDWAFPKTNAVQYLLGIETLLNNKQLNSLLEKHETQFNFSIHTNMLCYLNVIQANKQIVLINSSDKTIQDLLKESSLLITDYSSVAWDFYYLGKPVLFYQFDQEEYLTRTGSYIDFDHDLFGEVFKDCESLVSNLEKYITNNFKELPEYAAKRDSFFNFRDTDNCKRIFDTITPSQKF